MNPSTETVSVVGVGASAGGLHALTAFLDALPAETGLAYVFVQHLAPDHVSELHRLLRSHTPMPVHQVQDRVAVAPNAVYVIPPGRVLTLESGTDGERILVSTAADNQRRRFPIDRFFRSLATVQGDRAVCVVFSGTGTDGTLGLKAVKEVAGLCLVQDPDEADYDGMPRSAISTGLVDVVDGVTGLARRIATFATASRNPDLGTGTDVLAETHEDLLQSVFIELQRQTGHAFTGYKRATILRRLGRRMQVAEIDDLRDYVRLLEDRPSETRALFKDLLISVTSFFRDPATFRALETEIVPALFRDRDPGDTVRVWVPGCATGEEAFSLAMILEEFRRGRADVPEIQVFATDVDTDALEFARNGIYPASIATDVSANRLQRFFSMQRNGYQVGSTLMDAVLFAEHNLTSDPPFSRLDLVSCRNVLIYMGRSLQEDVFARLHYALRDRGYLFLGRSESPDSASSLFETVDTQNHIYRASDVPASARILAQPVTAVRNRPETTATDGQPKGLGSTHRSLIIQHHAPPSVLVNRSGHVAHVTGDVSPYMQLRDGIASFDLMELLVPSLRVVLRPAFFRALQGQRTSILWEGTLDGSTRTNSASRLQRYEDRNDAGTPGGRAPTDRVLQSLSRVESPTGQDLEEALRKGDIEPASSRPDAPSAEPSPAEPSPAEPSPADASSADFPTAATKSVEAAASETSSAETPVEPPSARAHALETPAPAKGDGDRSVTPPPSMRSSSMQARSEAAANSSGEAETVQLTLIAEPIKDRETGERYVLVVFDPTPKLDVEWRFGQEPDDDHTLYESMEEELRETQQRMRTLLEEYETSTEELQTSNEELQSMNEELRSATEELQIRKEELQSANEELLTVNEELTSKVAEVNRVNTDLENLMAATEIATLFLDRNLRLQRYTPHSLDIFDIQAGDLGRRIDDLEHTLRGVGVATVAREVYTSLQPQRSEVETPSATYLMNVLPYRTPDDRIDGIVLTFVNISDRVELRNERDEAHEASEMKSQMIANLSHEVRTPMTALLGFSEVLQEETTGSEVQRFGQLIYKSSLRLQQTLESVLHFSRLEAGKEVMDWEPVVVAKEVRDTYNEQRSRAEAHDIDFQLDVSMANEDVACRTDPGAIQRILRNLTGNAIKYTPRGGRVTLRCATGSRGILVEVEDTGIGMSRAFQQRMFDPFSQESEGHAREFEGVGLGLSIVRKLVDLISASLEVESTPGHGTRFAVFIPREGGEV